MWGEEELRMCALNAMSAYHGEETIFIPPETLERIMTRAVELKAASGGTMTAEGHSWRCAKVALTLPEVADEFAQHHAAQGARVAVLEASQADLGSRLDALAQEKGRWEEERAVLRPLISQLAAMSVEMAKVVGSGQDARMPSSAHPHFGCYPCSTSCTHDDAATPGHAERVRERSEAFTIPSTLGDPCACLPGASCHLHSADGEPSEAQWKESAALQDAHDRGAEAMREACWEAVQDWAANSRYLNEHQLACLKAAIEGAAP